MAGLLGQPLEYFIIIIIIIIIIITEMCIYTSKIESCRDIAQMSVWVERFSVEVRNRELLLPEL